MRDAMGIWSLRRPSGSPWPFQCSSSAPIPSAVASDKPINRARGSAAFTADCGDPACVLLLLRSHAQDCLDALEHGFARCYVGKSVLQRFPTGPRPIGFLYIAFGSNIIGRERMVNFRGVAAAAGIFEQESIKQVCLHRCGQSEFSGQPHPENAGADGVPLGRA
jgi:hypothetical protein